jgi:hypothetical protein
MTASLLSVGLDSAVVGLGLLLGAVAFQASRSYGESRFGLVGAALLLLACVGLLGSLGWAVDLGGPWSELGDGPAAVLLIAELLLLGSLALPRRTVVPPAGT